MATIKLIKARQIFDSRGNPTVEVSFLLILAARCVELLPFLLCVSDLVNQFFTSSSPCLFGCRENFKNSNNNNNNANFIYLRKKLALLHLTKAVVVVTSSSRRVMV